MLGDRLGTVRRTLAEQRGAQSHHGRPPRAGELEVPRHAHRAALQPAAVRGATEPLELRRGAPWLLGCGAHEPGALEALVASRGGDRWLVAPGAPGPARLAGDVDLHVAAHAGRALREAL